MKKRVMIALVTVWGLAMVGCGGNGSEAFNAYMGTYSGTWQSTELAETGTMSIVVDGGGQASGTIVDTGQGLTGGAVQATILSDGTFNGTAKYPGINAFIISGKVSHDGNGRIVGNLEQFKQGIAYDFVVKLDRH